jgi:hypothetical protein
MESTSRIRCENRAYLAGIIERRVEILLVQLDPEARIESALYIQRV